MLRLSSLFLFLIVSLSSIGQTSWQWTELAPMPFPTTNNAVCEAIVGGEEYVYSFGGLDSTKVYSGIHNRAFKYSVTANTWQEIDSLPDTQTNIAATASFVNGKIYIIGGYHVFQSGNEVSSNKVHIYNPSTDTYEAGGVNVPIPIDDHVQCVYKDSLIFVITGWSNSGNVPNVQIYDTYLDQWQVGTPTTNNAFFTAFGASGTIVGDTIYYHGGASGGSFGARKYMRKGYINPSNPTDIIWSLMPNAPGDAGYRSACSSKGNTVFWVGGSAKSYNYDGIAYDGTGPVNPSARILHFNNSVYQYSDEIPQDYGVMDLRGIAKLSGDSWIVCGGMDTNQVVSNRTFLLQNQSVGLEVNDQPELKVIYQDGFVKISSTVQAKARLMDITGSIIKEFDESYTFTISNGDYTLGIYYFIQEGKLIKIRL